MAVIKETIINLLNYRIQQEEQSSRLYESMSNWLDLKGFSGASKLWLKYSEEETLHKKWAIDYLLKLNILPIIPKQEQPLLEFKGLPQIIALSFEHEINITNQCKEFSAACLKEGDLITFNLAQKYLDEQVEEISKIQLWIDKLNSFGDDLIALRLLDNEMGG